MKIKFNEFTITVNAEDDVLHTAPDQALRAFLCRLAINLKDAAELQDGEGRGATAEFTMEAVKSIRAAIDKLPEPEAV